MQLTPHGLLSEQLIQGDRDAELLQRLQDRVRCGRTRHAPPGPVVPDFCPVLSALTSEFLVAQVQALSENGIELRGHVVDVVALTLRWSQDAM